MHIRNLLLFSIASSAIGGAQAYSCVEFNRDRAKANISKEELNGFESVNQKIDAITLMYLETFPQEAAEEAYKAFVARGDMHNPYRASLLVYKTQLQLSRATAEVIEAAIEKYGSLNAVYVYHCKNTKLDIYAILRLYTRVTQKEIGK